jgi:hypothetical protein
MQRDGPNDCCYGTLARSAVKRLDWSLENQAPQDYATLSRLNDEDHEKEPPMTGDMVTITLESKVSRRQDLLTSALSDREIVLLNIERGAYFGMEGVAKRIWDQLTEPRCVADLCATLLTRFAVDPDTCRREVLTFLTELHAKDLILVSTDSARDAGADTGADTNAGAGADADADTGTGAGADAGVGA